MNRSQHHTSQSKSNFCKNSLDCSHLTKALHLDFSRSVLKSVFASFDAPWHTIISLSQSIKQVGDSLPHDQYDEILPQVWVHTSAYLSPNAKISSPAIICGGAVISHFTHIESSVIGSFSFVGEFSSVKNSILFDKTRLCGHNSVNSTIIGYKSMLSHGAITVDQCTNNLNVSIDLPSGVYLLPTAKFGAIICDEVMIGSSAVLKSGSAIGTCAKIPPLCTVSGYVYPYAELK